MQTIELVYVRPFGDHRAFEVRLHDVVRRFGLRVQVTSGPASELTRITNDRVFLSSTVPNVVLVRCGEVIAQAIGDLPARELDSLLRTAVEHAGLAQPLAPAA